MTPSLLVKKGTTMETAELKAMESKLVDMISYHNCCCRHRILIPQMGKELEKTCWRPTLLVLPRMIKHREKKQSSMEAKADIGSPPFPTARKAIARK